MDYKKYPYLRKARDYVKKNKPMSLNFTVHLLMELAEFSRFNYKKTLETLEDFIKDFRAGIFSNPMN